jgi:hypothetical protein
VTLRQPSEFLLLGPFNHSRMVEMGGLDDITNDMWHLLTQTSFECYQSAFERSPKMPRKPVYLFKTKPYGKTGSLTCLASWKGLKHGGHSTRCVLHDGTATRYLQAREAGLTRKKPQKRLKPCADGWDRNPRSGRCKKGRELKARDRAIPSPPTPPRPAKAPSPPRRMRTRAAVLGAGVGQ